MSNILPHYLKLSYNNLLQSELVINGNDSEENIEYFENNLNNSLPYTYNDKRCINTYFFIKGLFNEKKYNAVKFFKETSCSPVILWSSNYNIVRHFNIEKLVYIKWDNENKRYNVEKFKDMKKVTNNKPKVDESKVDKSKLTIEIPENKLPTFKQSEGKINFHSDDE